MSAPEVKPSLSYRIVDGVVVVLCLPFYLIVWPLYRWSNHRFAKAVSSLACPHCGVALSGVRGRDLQEAGVRYRLSEGARMDWDRVPRKRVPCPACGEAICFSGRRQLTSCDPHAAVTVGPAETG